MYKITTFRSKNSQGKHPYSPYSDKTFDFKTIDVDTPYDLMRVLSSNFVLNISLNTENIRCTRTKKDLESHIIDNVQWLILDIDKVKSHADVSKVIEYFKNYKCIIGESRSHNGVDNFNLKGFLFCDIRLSEIKYAFQKVHYDLIEVCDIDTAASRIASLNAPINKVNIIYDGSKNTKLLTFNDFNVNIPKVKSITNNDLLPSLDLKNLNNLSLDNVGSADEFCLKIFESMGFNAISLNEDGGISFSHFTEVKTPGGYFWYRSSPCIMHHFNKSKEINIYDSIKSNTVYKELIKKSLDYNKELLKYNTDNKEITLNSRYLELTPEIKESIRNFIYNKDGLFTIRSPMGTGKSTIIKYIIDKALTNDMSVLIITNRISVAEDFAHKYNMKCYNRDDYKFGDSLICQFDSLNKYNIKNFDLVILDEFISLLFHSRSTVNNSAINCSKFFASFNKKLVIADAFLTGYENKLINKKENMYYLNNTYRDETPLYLYGHFNYFVQTILEKCKSKKVTISSTSLNIINALQLLLSKLGYRVISLTAETPSSTKELIYKIFEGDEAKWDVLLYSPTLTVGVSNLNDVDYHFHYDSSMTTDVISSLQMIKRSRKAKEIHLYIKQRINVLKTDFNDIKDQYLNSIGKTDNYIFSLNDYGEPYLSKLGKQCILIDTFKNILEFNHRNAFLFLLKYHFKNDVKEVLNTFSTNVLLKYQKENKDNNLNLNLANLEQYLKLNELDISGIDTFDAKNETEKAMKTLYSIDSRLKYVDLDIKREIITLCLKDRYFATKCKYWAIVQQLNNENEGLLQCLLSEAILKNDTCEIQFLTNLKEIKGLKILEEYASSSINNKSIKFICNKLGYTNRLKSAGKRVYTIDPNVLTYHKYFKI